MIEAIKSAVSAIDSCRNGKVSMDVIKAVAAAVSAGVKPPIALAGRKPFIECGTPKVAPPGSWPHFIRALVYCEAQRFDLAVLREEAKSGNEKSESRVKRMNYVVCAIHDALVLAKRTLEARDENAEREGNRRRTEARLAADKAKEDARRARQIERQQLLQASLQNMQAPEVVDAVGKPTQQAQPQGQRGRHPRLSIERVRLLLDRETKKRLEDTNVSPEDGKLVAARFVLGLVLQASHGGGDYTYTKEEVDSFKGEISLFVSLIYTAANPLRGAQALEQAEQWMHRQMDPRARRDDVKPSADETLSHRLDLRGFTPAAPKAAQPAAEQPAAEAAAE
ncbi:MAG: hypothetical protein WC641_03175 [Patescibacteria group bacterium]